MKRKILFVLPDYNKTTLRLVEPFYNKGFEIHVVAPFKFGPLINIVISLTYASNISKKLKRRKEDYKKIVFCNPKIISVSIFRLLSIIIRDIIAKRFYLSNSFKTAIEKIIIKKIKFN